MKNKHTIIQFFLLLFFIFSPVHKQYRSNAIFVLLYPIYLNSSTIIIFTFFTSFSKIVCIYVYEELNFIYTDYHKQIVTIQKPIRKTAATQLSFCLCGYFAIENFINRFIHAGMILIFTKFFMALNCNNKLEESRFIKCQIHN